MKKQDPKQKGPPHAGNTTVFGTKAPPVAGPVIDPRVTDPRALAYAAQATSRQAQKHASPAKYTEPVAGGRGPHIPRLDQPHQEGMTMEAQSPEVIGRQLAAQAAGNPALGGILQGDMPAPNMGNTARATGLLPTDILPDQAKQDPNFRSGQGSMYATSQPSMAFKYGVIRGGQYIAPQQLKSSLPGTQERDKKLSPQTLEGLKAIEDFNRMRENAESPEAVVEKKIEKDAKAGMAGTSSEVADSASAKVSEEDKKKLLSQIDDFDFHTFRTALMRDMLNNEEQKKLIEDRLDELDVGALISEGRVRQNIPIRPGIFEFVLQSYSGDEDLRIKRMLVEEVKSLQVSDEYVMGKYSLMGLTIALYSVNKVILPDYHGDDGLFNEDAFWRKYEIVSNFNYHMIASMATNWFWFDMRVRKLFVADKVGNG